MWKGTAEILNANPTIINTNPKIIPYSVLIEEFEILLKFVDPENPYTREQPYSNKPDDKALKTKYFRPDSDDKRLSLLNDAKTYKANDWSSKPK